MRSTLKFAAFAIALSGTATSAQVARVSPIGPPKTMTTGVSRVASTAQSAIHGIATDINAAPLLSAIVRLRNLSINQIEQTSTTNRTGEFTFTAKADVPYVVEIADKNGQVVAVSDIITARAGEVAGAFVSIPTRLSSPVGVFRDTVSSVISAATGTGLTAVEATAAPPDSPSQ